MQRPVRLDQHFAIFTVDMKHNGFGQNSVGVLGGAMASELLQVWKNTAAGRAAEFPECRGNRFDRSLRLRLGVFLCESDAFWFVHNEKPS
jgi:hypothetical protein